MDRATAFYSRLSWKHMFPALLHTRIAFWETLHVQRHTFPSARYNIFTNTWASTEFCQNFTLVAFLNRQNFQKMHWQLHDFAFLRAIKSTACRANWSWLSPKIQLKRLKSATPRWFLSASKLITTFRLKDAQRVVKKGKKGSKLARIRARPSHKHAKLNELRLSKLPCWESGPWVLQNPGCKNPRVLLWHKKSNISFVVEKLVKMPKISSSERVKEENVRVTWPSFLTL